MGGDVMARRAISRRLGANDPEFDERRYDQETGIVDFAMSLPTAMLTASAALACPDDLVGHYASGDVQGTRGPSMTHALRCR